MTERRTFSGGRWASVWLCLMCILAASRAEICMDAVCYFELDFRWDRTMVYRVGTEAYNVNFVNGTSDMVIATSLARLNDPMVGTPVDPRDLILADGYPRNTIVVNGQFPGPTLEVMEGAEVHVKVINNMQDEETSIHWHGMRMLGNTGMDGAPYVNQCPIAPGRSYTYRFIADPAGTHWYHSHFMMQRLDGACGTFIVHTAESAREQGFVFFYQDWFHVTARTYQATSPFNTDFPGTGEFNDLTLLTSILDFPIGDSPQASEERPESSPPPDGNQGRPADAPPPDQPRTRRKRQKAGGDQVPEEQVTGDIEDFGEARGDTIGPFDPLYVDQYDFSTLLNGRGRDQFSANKPQLRTFPVTAGNTYRIRLVNAGARRGMTLWIDAHKLRVVALDGGDIEPIVVDKVEITPGERIDVEIDADQPVGRYWIRRQMSPDKSVTGILSYLGDDEYVEATSEKLECTSESPCYVFNCMPGAFAAVLHHVCIDVQSARSTNEDRSSLYKWGDDEEYAEFFLNFDTPSIGFAINHIKHVEPSAHERADGLTYEPCELHDCVNSACECTQIITLEANQNVQFVLTNYDRGLGETNFGHHHLHLHGHNFAVVKQGYATVDPVTANILEANYDIDCVTSLCNHPQWRHEPEYNVDHPPIKDTVLVPNFGYTVIRFKADNPGFWLAHCHVKEHAYGGMMVMVVESGVNETWTPQDLPRCNYDYPNIQTGYGSTPTSDEDGVMMSLNTIIMMSVLLFVGGFVLAGLLVSLCSYHRNKNKKSADFKE